MLVRKVQHQGQFRWKKHEVFVSEVLWGERVGLLPVDEHCFIVYFAQVSLARFDSRHAYLTPLTQPGETKAGDFYRKGAKEGEASPSSALHPSTNWTRKCQVCARSKLSGMPPAAQSPGDRRDRKAVRTSAFSVSSVVKGFGPR